MPRQILLLVALLVMLAVSPLAWIRPVVPAFAADATPAFSGPSAHRYVNALAVDIGSRPVGSENDGKAQQYLLARYRELGYQADLQPFTVTTYDDRGSTLSLDGSSSQFIATTLQFSGAGDVQGQLVEAGLGRPEDYDDADVSGKMVLVGRGDTRFVDKVNAAAAAGATAVVIYNNAPGNFTGSLIGVSTIPALSVSQADGKELLRATQNGGASAHVTVNGSMAQVQAANVVAVKPGGPQSIVVGGHFDSVPAGPGANDNGSGTATTLELARVLAQAPTPFTLRFVAFDAEEVGLVGSSYYVSHLSDAERQSIVAMINLDMVGVGTETMVGGSDELTTLARAAAGKLGESAGTMGQAPAGSDHASFLGVGIPALFIYRSNDPNYHSPNDLAQYLDDGNLELAGRMVLDIVASLEQAQ